jgi:hypothetical protein
MITLNLEALFQNSLTQPTYQMTRWFKDIMRSINLNEAINNSLQSLNKDYKYSEAINSVIYFCCRIN